MSHASSASRRIAITVILAWLIPLLGHETVAQVATPVASPAASPIAGEAVYRDPGGRFTVPIPTNWRAETVDGYGVLSDPDRLILVYALAVDGTDVTAALAEAWRRVEPDFAEEELATLDVPPPPGVEQAVVVTYDTGLESGEVVQGFGQLVDGVVYVLLFRADLAAATRRNAQIQIIASGLTITGVAEIDLSAVAPRTLTPAMLAELEAYIAATMTRLDVPGASVAVVQDGAVIFSEGFGVRELGGSDPVTPRTLMMIGSTTKSMTTLLMATLVDDGLMEWDTPVVDLLPTFAVADPALTPRITMRNLVCACTGVPGRHLELAFNANELSAEEVVASLAGFAFFTAIGEAFQYSNQMVAAAGYIAAIAAGGTVGSLYADYVAAMRERVLDPIGMPASTFLIDDVQANPDHATPHTRSLDGSFAPIPLAVERLLDPVAPAGALWSNAEEMARYLITELTEGVALDGTRVVSAANLRQTWQPQVPVSAGISYGLGWFVDSYKGQPMIHHAGNTLGFTADLAFLPDAGLGVVVLANGQATNLFTEAVRFRLLELAFDQAHEYEELVTFAVDLQEQAIGEIAASIGEPVPPENVAPYLGRFANPALGELTLALEGRALILDAGEFRSELRPAIGDAAAVAGYLVIDPPLAGLPIDLRSPDGTPQVVVIDLASAEEYVFTPVADGPATPVAGAAPATPEVATTPTA